MTVAGGVRPEPTSREPMEVVLLLLINIISGTLSSSIFGTKGCNGGMWFLAGFLFGPLGLVAAAGLPDQRLRVYLRHLASEKGWQDDASTMRDYSGNFGDADAQRKRILGIK